MSGLLVHEWLARTGGSENVFEVLRGMFPDARSFALWNDSDGRFSGVEETFLARTPLRRSKALSLPLMPLAWRHLPEADADWILCSTHVFAHHARFAGPARDAPKYLYVHTPARYIWTPELDGRGNGPLARTMGAALKPVDRKRAQEAHAIAANSRFVAERIERAWGRESTVIYPPVDVERFGVEPELTPLEQDAMNALPKTFLLGVSRFVPYKRLDLVIRAGAAADLPVVLAGQGPDEQRLRALADELHPGAVTFVDHPSFAQLRALYRAASALVFAPIEDFGIVPVEAMASGTPVIVNAIGGASESVLDGETGAHVHDWESREMKGAVERALSCEGAASRDRAAMFAEGVFRRRVRSWLQA